MNETPDSSSPDGVRRLDLTSESGTWVVSTDSATRYFLDLDAGLLLRQPGTGSSTGPFDGVWVHLVQVESAAGFGAVELGYRHKYTLDPDPHGTGALIWWIQRTATGIHPVAAIDVPTGRVSDAGEYNKPWASGSAKDATRAEAGAE